ncbi:MAG TPA: biotin/lipoate--protein ligase family protein [Pseudolabrys sp.]|jgi:biotin-(acetyl-CoA carboxylase) ligase|nr:biotin/lipoate--protein ligase family protein [Pseudolabrys sp.]
MSRLAQSRIRDASTELTLPSLYTPVRLREWGDAFAHAGRIAAERGAGTLVHVGRFDLAEFALVLEPEEPLAGARRAFYAGMTALADALIGCSQPETDVAIRWPDTVLVNGGLVGGGRLAWPKAAGENAVPPWLVFGAMVRVESMTDREPGVNPNVTTLAEEGFGGLRSHEVIESFARHFMVAIDAWQEIGFAAVAKTYVERLPRVSGMRRDIDENGDLLIRRTGTAATERKSLVAALAAPSWLDGTTEEPLT